MRDVDLTEIFISRQKQINQFKDKLKRWLQSVENHPSSGLETPPSPDEPILGMIVFLTGLGGIGKTQLLKRYYEIAQGWSKQRIVQTSKLIDCESALAIEESDYRLLFMTASREKIDGPRYFKFMHALLAKNLGKDKSDFKNYQETESSAKQAKNHIEGILSKIIQDE